VAKKHRLRARSRRAVEASRRASAARPATPEREPTRAGAARTVRYGAPSAGLERAATWERGYVTKDFRRMAIVVVIALALLVVAGILLNVFER
jgi:hypothetical protein